jgi:hypothetical protein
MKLKYKNTRFLLINHHLKAYDNRTARCIREVEAVLVQRLIQKLIEEDDSNSKPLQWHVIVAGDFNDLDDEISSVPLPTTVLRRIKNMQDSDIEVFSICFVLRLENFFNLS